MTRKYSLVIEGDQTGYGAYVPELPGILVTGRSMEELTARAAGANSSTLGKHPTGAIDHSDGSPD